MLVPGNAITATFGYNTNNQLSNVSLPWLTNAFSYSYQLVQGIYLLNNASSPSPANLPQQGATYPIQAGNFTQSTVAYNFDANSGMIANITDPNQNSQSFTYNEGSTAIAVTAAGSTQIQADAGAGRRGNRRSPRL